MAKLSQMKAKALHRILIYGPPKLGKTYQMGLLASKFKLHWFDIENGINTLLQDNFSEELRDNIIVYQLPDSRIYPIAIETLLKVVLGNPVRICEEHGKVGCLICAKEEKVFQEFCLKNLGPNEIFVIDSLNQLQLSAMNHITKGKDDLYKPDWEDFRNQGSLMDKILSVLQQAPCHVACATHETEAEMEDGGKKLVPIAGTTNFSRNTAKYFDHVVYLTTQGNKYRLISNELTSPKITAGSRSSVDLSKMESPSLLAFFGDVDYSAEAHKPKSIIDAAAMLDDANKLAASGATAGTVGKLTNTAGAPVKANGLASLLSKKA